MKHIFNVCVVKSPKVGSVLFLHNRMVSESNMFSSIILNITIRIDQTEFQVAVCALKED